MKAEMHWEDERTGAEEEAALGTNTYQLRQETKEMERRNAALAALLARRRIMIEELRERIRAMDAENAQISREVAEILGSPS